MVKDRQYRTQLLQRPLSGEIKAKLVDRSNYNFALSIECTDRTTVTIPITEQAYDIIYEHDLVHKEAHSPAITISRKGQIILQTTTRPLPVRKKDH